MHQPASAYPTGNMSCDDIGKFAEAVVIGKHNGQTMKQALAKVNAATVGHPVERKNMTQIVRSIYTWASGMSEEGARTAFLAECGAQAMRARVEMSEDEIKATASLIRVLKRSGHLRLECSAGKAWINTHDWQEYSIFEKEKMTHVIHLACANESEAVNVSQATQAIVLYDLQSDKKLASYSPLGGFWIY
jgi:hypothetical protein